MSEVVGVAEVIVRPVTTGFAAAAETGIASEGKKIGRDLSKAILAGFAIGGLVEGIKSVVEAATRQNTAFAVLDQALKNAGQSAKGFSASLRDTLERQARATGVSAEDLAAAMSRLVPATGNAKKSLKDLNTALGISETYHIDLSTAALALAKAETGSFNSLQRYLGKIKPVTDAQDALKARYQALINQNVKLDAAQKAQYTSALAAAKATDAQATAQQALTTAAQKFAGVPQTFAKSYQGQFDRLHVAVEQLKVAIGTELVGGLAAGAGGLANYIDKLVASDRVQTQVHKEIQALRGDFGDIKSAVKEVGPPILTLTDNLGGFVKVAGALGAALLARKFVAWGESLGAASAAEATTTASAAAFTDALAVNTAALEANTIALGGEAAGLTTVGREAVVSTGKVAGLRSGLLGLANKAFVATIILSLIPKSGKGQSVLDQLGAGFLGHLPILGGADTQAAKYGAELGKAITGSSPFDALNPIPKGYVNPIVKKGQSEAAQVTAIKANATLTAAAKQQLISDVAAGWTPKQIDEYAAALTKTATAVAAKTAKTAAKNAATVAKDAALASAEQTLKDTVSADKSDLTLIQQNLADAIRQGAQAVVDAVNQAKQNLNSIGGSLASEIQAVLIKPITDAQQKITEESDKLNVSSAKLTLAQSQTTLRNLGRSVLLPGGHTLSSDPKRAIAQLQALEKKTASPALTAFLQNYQAAFLGEQNAQIGVRSAGITVASDKLTREGQTAQKRIETLTDAFNNKRIGKGQLATGIKGVLSNLGITGASASAVLGPLGGDTVQALVKGITEQAGAIAAGPQRAGNGLVPSITRPLQTLHDQQRQINQLRHEEFTKTLAESKAQTKLLKDIANGKAADKFTSSLSKNPGSGSKRTQSLTGTTR